MRTVNSLIGSAIERLEDLRFLRGRGQYVDDLARKDMLHAAFLRSSVAHGRAIDDDGAGAAHAVLAAHMGPSQPQRVAQAVRQRQPRFDLDLDLFAIDLKLHRHAQYAL